MTTQATVIGNLTADPEHRVSQAGKSWTTIRVASTVREKDRDTDQWRDSDPLFVSIPLFGDMADHAVQSLKKGTRIIAIGTLKNRSYRDNQGNERIATELVNCGAIGPDLRWATAEVTRNGGQSARQGGPGTSGAPQAGGWSSDGGNGAQNADFGRAAFDDEQPF